MEGQLRKAKDYLQAKEYHRALELFSELIQHPEEVPLAVCYAQRATCHLHLNHSEALSDAQKATELNPDNAIGQLALGRSLYRFGRYEEASRALQLAINLDPSHEEVTQWEAEKELAKRSFLLQSDPEHVWMSIKHDQKFIPVECGVPIPEMGVTVWWNVAPSSIPPKSVNSIRCVCISDTHERVEQNENYVVPLGDILFHAGDWTQLGDIPSITRFHNWFSAHPHPVKILIPGNHDMCTSEVYCKSQGVSDVSKIIDTVAQIREKCHLLLGSCLHCTRAVHDSCTCSNLCVALGLTIFGSPHTCWKDTASASRWPFATARGTDCKKEYKTITEKPMDIVLTHMPPLGRGDDDGAGGNGGCVELLAAVQHRPPRVHMFGHAHAGYGVTWDGKTVFINGAAGEELKPAVVFDVEVK